MRSKWTGLLLLALALTLLSAKRVQASGVAPSPGVSAAQDRAWDAPPDEFRDVQRQGFHDGIEAARHDFEAHRRADADDHSEFRHPRVPHDQRDSYREGFRRGYEKAMSHMNGDRDHY